MSLRILAPALFIAATALLLVASPGQVQPAGAQQAVEPAAVLEVRFTDIDAVVTDRSEPVTVIARLENTGTETISGAEATLAAYPRVPGRFAYQQAVERADGPGGRVVGRVRRAVADVPPGAVRFVAVRSTLRELGVTSGSAVHPLQLELAGRTGDGPPRILATRTTALVALTTTVVSPVATALGVVFPSPVPDDEPVDVEGITGLAGDLAQADAPVAVVVDELLIDRLRADSDAPSTTDATPPAEPIPAGPDPSAPTSPSPSPADGTPPTDGGDPPAAPLAALEGLLAEDDVERLALPYAHADVVALHRQDATGRAETAWELGIAGEDTPPLVPPAGLDAATLTDLVASLEPPAVVLPEPYLDLDPQREVTTTPNPVRPLTTASGDAAADAGTAVVPDPWLQPVLDDLGALAPADVQRILAETAVVYLERPGSSDTRGLFLLAGAAGLSDVASGLAAGPEVPTGAAELATALADAPWVALTPVEKLATDVPPGDPVTPAYPPGARAAELPAGYVAALEAADDDVASVSRLLDADDPGLAELRTRLLVAASTAFRDDPAAGRKLIDAVVETAGDLFGAVEVRTQPTVTFTDESGQVPVLITNGAPVALTVRVALSSRRLEFERNGREITLEPETTSTVVFATRARTPGGTAPVVVEVTDPSGHQQLARGSIRVRVASYPALGIVLLVGGGLVLLLWAVREWRRRGVDARAGGPRRPGRLRSRRS